MGIVAYVVTLVGDDIANPHKCFTDRQAAQEHALTFEGVPGNRTRRYLPRVRPWGSVCD